MGIEVRQLRLIFLSSFREELAFAEAGISQQLFQQTVFATQRIDFTNGIALQMLLTGFDKVYRPVLVKIWVNAFASADCCNAIFTAPSFKDDVDVLFR